MPPKKKRGTAAVKKNKARRREGAMFLDSSREDDTARDAVRKRPVDLTGSGSDEHDCGDDAVKDDHDASRKDANGTEQEAPRGSTRVGGRAHPGPGPRQVPATAGQSQPKPHHSIPQNLFQFLTAYKKDSPIYKKRTPAYLELLEKRPTEPGANGAEAAVPQQDDKGIKKKARRKTKQSKTQVGPDEPADINSPAHDPSNQPKSEPAEVDMASAYIPPNQHRHMRACMVCAIVRTYQQFMSQGCPNCEAFMELTGSADAIQDCTSQVFDGLLTVSNTSKSWVARYQRLEGYVPGVYAVQVEGVLPEDVVVAAENAGVHYIPRDGSVSEALPTDS